ncbi:unnamed protein product (macronuclear) [Paramecium tetraurelia]|uniref:Ubiquitin-like protease family profile domain-containing protein n=1 Tax=Paramecium tetraurelia TaxID=5888 RepID=A0BY28_PARTE|nr:uncharacterized protein GSPATT00033298001 [Paramecium tetraurelia]CAK63445.1 unnamed protein product [Paramecium tetraurelia]|eukprot:XP_001430843.1 hypothetical protein (macronuclear) [Paramecium tetraurelia strain d4-2]
MKEMNIFRPRIPSGHQLRPINESKQLKNQFYNQRTTVYSTKNKEDVYIQSNKGKQKQEYNQGSQTKQQILNRLCDLEQLTFRNIKEQEKLKQQKYDSLILSKNQLFYCKSESYEKIDDKRIKIQGKRYLTELDINFNPRYLIQEGKFSANLNTRDFKFEEGNEYLGKSNQIKPQEKIENQLQQQSEQNKTKTSQFRAQSLAPSRIIIREQGIIVNNYRNLQIKRVNKKVWCKYNQQINERDETILKSKNWLTSSIIDSFVFYLNLESENQYFKTSLDKQEDIKRILFLPTTLTTCFGKSYDFKKAQDLFQQELLQFQEMNFEIKNFYTKVGFPINKNNYHWQFILFDYEKNTVELFDSSKYLFDQNLIKTLQKLLNLENAQVIENTDFGEQNNGYACGYYVCTFMLYFYQLQFPSQFQCPQKIYDEENITKKLKEIIKNMEPQ